MALSSLKNYFKRFLRNIKGDIIREDTALHFYKTSNMVFKLNHVVVEEIKYYCRKRGYTPDRICFVSYFDMEEVLPHDIISESENKIFILKNQGKIVVFVFLGSFRERHAH